MKIGEKSTGFWNRDVENSFDRMFDYNRDGYLDMFEQAIQYEFLEGKMKSTAGDVDESDSFDEDGFDYMDDEERWEALEKAGVDPDEYDDY